MYVRVKAAASGYVLRACKRRSSVSLLATEGVSHCRLFSIGKIVSQRRLGPAAQRLARARHRRARRRVARVSAASTVLLVPSEARGAARRRQAELSRPAQERVGPRLGLWSRRRTRSATAASRAPRQSGESSPCRGQRESARDLGRVFGAAGALAARQRQAEFSPDGEGSSRGQ